GDPAGARTGRGGAGAPGARRPAATSCRRSPSCTVITPPSTKNISSSCANLRPGRWVTGSQRGSHSPERLPAQGERTRTGGWRSSQPTDRSGQRRPADRYLRICEAGGSSPSERAPPSAPRSAAHCDRARTLLVRSCRAPTSAEHGGRRTRGALSALEGPETQTIEQLGHELLAFPAWGTARGLGHQPRLVGGAGPGRAAEGAHYVHTVASVLPRRTADQGSLSDRLVETNACSGERRKRVSAAGVAAGQADRPDQRGAASQLASGCECRVEVAAELTQQRRIAGADAPV